jgi:hypothetical protein
MRRAPSSIPSWPSLRPALDIQHAPNAPSYLYHSSKTYAKRGTKMIHMRKMSNGTKRATGALTVTAASNFLTPMIIFKNKPNGKIEIVELKNFNPTSIYACQDAAWMDE